MGLRLSQYARLRAASAALTTLDLAEGGAPGTLEVYAGAQPADPDTNTGATPLVVFTLSNPAFAGPINGTASLNSVAPAVAAGSGTAGWFRMKDGNGNGVMDGTVGTTGANLNLSSTAITAGGTVAITSGSVSMPVGV